MSRFIRLLSVWLIVLTLPFQGVSAAVMSMQMASPDAGQATQVAPVAKMAMAGCHGMMVMADQASHAPDAGHMGHDHAPVKAKVCGACCVGVLLGAQSLPQLPGQASNSYLRLIAHEPVGVIPGGLERPPRSNS